jgi:hypothetical protein
MKLNQQLVKLKEELATAKRTIANYRKMVTDMQKDFFKSSKQTAPSTNSGFTGVKLGPKDNSSVGEHADDDSTNSLVYRGAGRDRNTTESFSVLEGESASQNRISGQNTLGFSSQARREMGKQASHVIRVNYNFVCDLERFEKFNGFTATFADCKRVPKFLLLFLEQIRFIV